MSTGNGNGKRTRSAEVRLSAEDLAFVDSHRDWVFLPAGNVQWALREATITREEALHHLLSYARRAMEAGTNLRQLGVDAPSPPPMNQQTQR